MSGQDFNIRTKATFIGFQDASDNKVREGGINVLYIEDGIFLKNKKKDVKVHEIVVAAIIMEMIREQPSTICLARVW